MDRTVNRNTHLYGPGPVARRMGGLAARPPLQSLVIIAGTGLVFAFAGANIWRFGWGDPELKAFEDYYKENPPR